MTEPDPMTRLVSTLETPDGPFTLVEDGAGTVHASGWTRDVALLLSRAGTPGVRLLVREGPPSAAALAVRSFYEGDPAPLLDVPVEQRGSGFQVAVWSGLRRIPAGSVLTYAELAVTIGHPRAARAVGAACGRNAVALFVPCHRVVGAGGGLTGFAWGVDVKRHLLGLEGGLP